MTGRRDRIVRDEPLKRRRDQLEDDVERRVPVGRAPHVVEPPGRRAERCAPRAAEEVERGPTRRRVDHVLARVEGSLGKVLGEVEVDLLDGIAIHT